MLYLLCLLNKSNQTEKYMYILLNKNAFSNCKNALWRGGSFVSYICTHQGIAKPPVLLCLHIHLHQASFIISTQFLMLVLKVDQLETSVQFPGFVIRNFRDAIQDILSDHQPIQPKEFSKLFSLLLHLQVDWHSLFITFILDIY